MPDIIVGLSFGAHTDEGSPNYHLAEAVDIAMTVFPETPALVQPEIGRIETDRGRLESYEQVYTVAEPIQGKNNIKPDVDTWDAIEKSLEIAEEEDVDAYEALYVAHPAHVSRVMKTGSYLGLDGEPFISENRQWSSEDSQWWVRGPMRWAAKELFLARPYCHLKGNTRRLASIPEELQDISQERFS